MNPWSFYEHQPQLVEAVVVAAAASITLRQRRALGSLVGLAAWACLAWGTVGVVDYCVYAFGYTLARWGASEISSVQLLFEWLRVPILLFAAAMVYSEVKRHRSDAPG